MKRLFVHYLTPCGLESWQSSGARMKCVVRHPDTDDGRQAFGKWLDAHKKHDHMLIAGLREEEYQHIPIPCISSREKRELLRRRLQQHFPDAPFATGFEAGSSTLAGEIGLILAAIPPPTSLQSWAGVLLDHEAILISVRSPALLLPHMLSALKVKSKTGLLVYSSSAGQHHVHFENDRPHFTRLVANPDTSDQQTLEAELDRTLQYLGSRKSGAVKTSLDVILLSAETADAIPLCASRFPNVRMRRIGVPGLAFQSGNRDDCTSFLLEVASRHTSGPQFAPPSHLKQRRLKKARLGVLALGGAGSIGLAALTAVNIQQTSTLSPFVETVRQTVEELQTEHTRLQQEIASLPMDAASLMELARISESGERFENERNVLLRKLSFALDLNPAIELDLLAWSTTASDATPDKRSMTLRIAGIMNESTAQIPDQFSRFRTALISQDFDIQEFNGSLETSASERPEAASNFLPRFSWRLSLIARESQ